MIYKRMPSLLFAATLILGTVYVGCQRASPPPEHASGSMDHGAVPVEEKEMARLPAFTFPDLAGRPVSSEQFKGKILVVDVWATWCPPCKTEMPWFQEFSDEYKEQGVEVIGISIDPNPADAARFAKEMGITYTLLHHPAIMQEWGLLGLPTTFIVDREGLIRRKVIGFEYKEAFEAALKELL